MTENGKLRNERMNECTRRLADELTPGMYVNIGIGLPQLVTTHLDGSSDVIQHCENGLLGIGGVPDADDADDDFIDAGKRPVTPAVGAALMHHADSFALIRSGRLDVAVMGALQVSQAGDLANWWRRESEAPAVGGAMDLVVGAKRVLAVMTHVSRDGTPKLLESCTLPLTGAKVVDAVYTDFGKFVPRGDHFEIAWLLAGVSFDEAQRHTGAELVPATEASTTLAETGAGGGK